MHVFSLHVLDQAVIHALKANGMKLHYPDDVISSRINIRVSKNYKTSIRGAIYQTSDPLKDGNAGALRPYQSFCHVKPVFRQQIIQVITRNAAGNFGIARANLISIPVAEITQLRVDFRSPSAFRNDLRELFVTGCANGKLQAVISEHTQLFNVLYRLTAHYRMHAAGVV